MVPEHPKFKIFTSTTLLSCTTVANNNNAVFDLWLPLQEGGGELDLDQSSEILTFHTAIDNLVESEEHLVTEHKAIIQADQYLLEEEKQLLEYVDDVNHDIEQYVTHMERIVSQKVERLSKFKGEWNSCVLISLALI